VVGARDPGVPAGPHLEPAQPGWTDAVARLGEAADVDIGDYAGYVRALEQRRMHFIANGATSADHRHDDVRTDPLEPSEAERIYRAALAGEATASEALAFRRHMLENAVRERRMDVRLKRAYEPAARADGCRVLIDRLWPRGVSRQQAELDGWEKELSPSPELRQWFGHEPQRFQEFRLRYIDELRSKRPQLTALRCRARKGTLTLVYSAHDTEHNDAVVLAEVLRRGLPKGQA
jgi:uncharacterized protein YeaO (DUF488 family)